MNRSNVNRKQRVDSVRNRDSRQRSGVSQSRSLDTTSTNFSLAPRDTSGARGIQYGALLSPTLSSCGEERENINSGQAVVVSRCAPQTRGPEAAFDLSYRTSLRFAEMTSICLAWQNSSRVCVYRSEQVCSGGHPGCRRGRHPAARPQAPNRERLPPHTPFPPGKMPGSTAGRMPAATVNTYRRAATSSAASSCAKSSRKPSGPRDAFRRRTRLRRRSNSPDDPHGRHAR